MLSRQRGVQGRGRVGMGGQAGLGSAQCRRQLGALAGWCVCVGGVVFQAWAGSTGADGRGGGRWGAGPCPQPGRVTRAPPGLVAQPGWGMGTSTRVSAGARAGDEDIGVVGPVLGVRGMKVGTAPSSLFSRGRQRGTGAWFLAQSTQLAGGGAGFQPRPWFQNPQLFPPLYSGPLRTP